MWAPQGPRPSQYRHGDRRADSGYVSGVNAASPGPLDALVIGAGVSGLTSAICLAESGLRVGVRAAEEPHATTSVVAGALWGTHLVGGDERLPGWADQTYAMLLDLAADPATGVHLENGLMAVKVPQDVPPEAPNAT